MFKCGGRKSLQLTLNVIGDYCGGCNFESYPYKAELPIVIDGKRPTWIFESDEDVWKVIDLIIQETKELNETEGKQFDIELSVQAQLPFFSCKNRLFSREMQKDIQRYMYCEKFGVSPYSGDFGKQPCLWVDKVFIIKKAFANLEKNQIKKAKKDGSRKN